MCTYAYICVQTPYMYAYKRTYIPAYDRAGLHGDQREFALCSLQEREKGLPAGDRHPDLGANQGPDDNREDQVLQCLITWLGISITKKGTLDNLTTIGHRILDTLTIIITEIGTLDT